MSLDLGYESFEIDASYYRTEHFTNVFAVVNVDHASFIGVNIFNVPPLPPSSRRHPESQIELHIRKQEEIAQFRIPLHVADGRASFSLPRELWTNARAQIYIDKANAPYAAGQDAMLYVNLSSFPTVSSWQYQQMITSNSLVARQKDPSPDRIWSAWVFISASVILTIIVLIGRKMHNQTIEPTGDTRAGDFD